jgi:Fe-S-cluster containining protein
MASLKFKQSSCHCKTCNDMCTGSPCWPTPGEAKRLVEAYPDRVAFDESYYLGGRHVRLMRPAAVGESPMSVNRGYAGRCVFYKNQRCELHYTGMKPLEGRLSTHEYNHEQRDQLRFHIGRMWLEVK